MIHINSFLHTLSVYANRWGGPRYRTSELVKFLHKHLYDKQKNDLQKGIKINTSLIPEAFLSSSHSPLYCKDIIVNKEAKFFEIKDELGYVGQFSEGTELLVSDEKNIFYMKIEDIDPLKHKRIINLEFIPELKNSSLHTHTKFNRNFRKIICGDLYEKQKILCDALTSMTILKEDPGGYPLKVNLINKFDKENDQEVYLIDIEYVRRCFIAPSFILSFSPFSHFLQKDRQLSDKSNKRYYNGINKEKPRKYLEKMRKNAFRLKKDKVTFEMELFHEKNNS